MQTICVLGGYGEMGTVATIDLSHTFPGTILIAGRDQEKARAAAKSFKDSRIISTGANAHDVRSLAATLKEHAVDVIMNATQYDANLDVMEAALAAGAHYVDLGGLFHMTRKQVKLHERFRKRHLTAVLGCGATPGITNVMAAHGVTLFSSVDSIHVQFAGKDWTAYDTPFVVPYSMRTVFDEFMMKPAVFADRKLRFVEPMSGVLSVPFPEPIGPAQCFYTLHSEVATFPDSFKKYGIKNCSFRGGFDRSFADKVKFLVDTGFANTEPVNGVVPRDFTVQVLNRCIPHGVAINDLEFLRVELTGLIKGKKRTVVCYARSLAQKKWNIPAGSWDTGVPPSIAAQMLCAGEITERGALPPERCIQPAVFFNHLAERNIQVTISGK